MRNEKGFTLIELLVVVAIIGILAAIAIPQFAEYKTRAFNSRSQSDLRNGLTAQEAYFVDHDQYVACSEGGCADGTATSLPGFVISEGVHVGYDVDATSAQFAGASCHERGDKEYTWQSTGGGAGVDNVIQSADAAGACAAVPGIPAL